MRKGAGSLSRIGLAARPLEGYGHLSSAAPRLYTPGRSVGVRWYTCPVLSELRVENLLLIERAQLRLSPGLNVLTGETGAGKTVLAQDRKSTRLNSSHLKLSRMPSSA